MSKCYCVNISIPKEGIINYYSNKGYNDVIFVVEEEEIFGISLFLKEKNVILKKMIEDENREEKIQIEKVSKLGFSSLIKYYGYGMIELDESNIFDILMACVCYNEIILLEECKKYILKNSNIELIQRMFNEIPMSEYDPLKEMKLKVSDYLSIYGNEIFKDENLQNNNIELLKYILSLNNFVIKSENYLFTQLKKIDDDMNNKNEMIELYKSIKIDEMEEKEKSELIEILKENGENELKEDEINRIYIDNEPTNNEAFNKWFYLYCLKHETNNKLLEEEKYYLYKLSLLDLQSLLPQLLNSKTILTLSNSIDLIHQYKLEYNLKKKYPPVLKLLSSKYLYIQKKLKNVEEVKKEENENEKKEEKEEEKQEKEEDDVDNEKNDEKESEEKERELSPLEIQKNSIVKAMMILCHEEILIQLIKYECEDENVLNNFNKFIPQYYSFCDGLFDYYKSNNQSQEEESTNNLPPSYFKYPKDEYYSSVFHLPLIIKSKFVGENCEFSIDNTSNIECDKYTGDLTINGVLNNTYTITCKNEIGSISTKIKIEVFDIREGYKTNFRFRYDYQKHRVNFNDEGYFVFDYCFREGIYQIKCYCESGISIAACITSNNTGCNNTKYRIADGYNETYILLFDLMNKQIGYRKENEKEMKIVRTFSDSSLYLIVESMYHNIYFEIQDIERIK